ncbi:uncharacterized protein LOC141741136 [Larus michahellis]|uniref:uncharacterized protein LOC141741136 n=1 Tax=Larus michahellis TaxID=119627 RepID=UPI003D9BD393
MYMPLPVMRRGIARLNEALTFLVLFTREGLGQHGGELADRWNALLLQTVLSPGISETLQFHHFPKARELHMSWGLYITNRELLPALDSQLHPSCQRCCPFCRAWTSHRSRAPGCDFTFRLPVTAAPSRSEPSFHQHHLQLISNGIPYSLGEHSSQVWLLLGDYFKAKDSSSHTITSFSFLKSSGLRASVLEDTMRFPFPYKESLWEMIMGSVLPYSHQEAKTSERPELHQWK